MPPDPVVARTRERSLGRIGGIGRSRRAAQSPDRRTIGSLLPTLSTARTTVTLRDQRPGPTGRPLTIPYELHPDRGARTVVGLPLGGLDHAGWFDRLAVRAEVRLAVGVRPTHRYRRGTLVHHLGGTSRADSTLPRWDHGARDDGSNERRPGPTDRGDGARSR